MTKPLKTLAVAFMIDGEPYFTLRGSDLQAPELIRQWAKRRREMVEGGRAPLDDLEHVRDALQCATNMELWWSEQTPVTGQVTSGKET